ncbi:MAG: beta-propeller fold lactonase family protein, partial [Nitrososphaerales archaeon]
MHGRSTARVAAVFVLLLFALSILLSGSFVQPAHAQTMIYVGDNPTGVAVNPTTNTVYVTNSGDGTVTVINGADNSIITTIPVGSGNGSDPIDVAVNPTTNLVYVANSGDGTVTVIDGATNTVDPVSPITVGSA